MPALTAAIEARHRLIIGSLGAVILFFLAACILNGVIPVCHYVFGCDHAFGR